MIPNSFKVTVIVDAITPQQWVVSTLEKLQQTPFLHIDCILLQPISTEDTDDQTSHAIGSQTPKPGGVSNLITRYIDRPLFPTGPQQSTRLSNGLDQLLLNSTNASINDAIPKKTDLVLHLGSCSQALPHNTPQAKNGIWFIDTAELNNCVQHNTLTHPALHWLHLWKWTDNTCATVERVASHALPMQSFSTTDINTYTFGALSDFIVSRLNWLANGINPTEREAAQIKPELYNQDAFPLVPGSKQLSNLQCCIRSVGLLLKQSRARLRNLMQHEQWQLAFTHSDGHVFDKAVRDFQSLTPAANTTWADPHLIVDGDKTHVFMEAIDDGQDRGKIAHTVLTQDGFEHVPRTVLEEPHHLSYPFVFKHEEAFYMIPETATRRNITLYKARNFPDGWEKVCNLIDNIDAADTTLFQHDGLWWIFTNGMSHPAVDERDLLMLFYAEDLFSNSWTPHPLNPIVTGVDRSRMAGAIYIKDGDLFRPSQYGAKRYGFGINISNITTLSTTDYQETLVGRLKPSNRSGWIGCHTAVHNDQFIMIDRLQRVSKRRGSGANYQGHGLHQPQPDQ